MYPFLYVTETQWVVSIGEPFNYIETNESWQKDEVIGDFPMVPSPDLVKVQHVFNSEREALLFIQKWWSEQDIASWYPG